jgi:hypothetical protein
LTTNADDLRAARLAFPVGERVRGAISTVPLGAGRAGVLVDLGRPPDGWVDVLHLPEDPANWPAIGTTGRFEVLQHLPGQVRLFPLDAGMRGRRTRYSRWSGEEWAAITKRHPEGSMVDGTVADVFIFNREYTVRFGDCWSVVEYDDAEPVAGSTGAFGVTRLLQWTRRILLTPATTPSAK